MSASESVVALEERARSTFSRSLVPDHDGADLEGERARIYDSQADDFECLCSVPAATLEGICAKARSLVIWSPELLSNPGGDRSGRLLAALVADLLSLASGRGN